MDRTFQKPSVGQDVAIGLVTFRQRTLYADHFGLSIEQELWLLGRTILWW